MKPLRIAHLSDIHFGGDENVAAVRAATERLAADPPDLVVVSGDLTRIGGQQEFRAAAAWLQTLPTPQLVVPGNHDTPYMAWFDRVFRPFARYEHSMGPAEDHTFSGEGLAVYAINTARGVQPRANWSKGQVSARQSEAACAWFEDAPKDALRILVCHHPLTEMIGGPMTGRVWGGAAAAECLASSRVDLVLSGHIHAPFVLPYPYGDGRTYAAGASTLSIRERGAPAGFNMVEAEGADLRVTAMAWTGSTFEPARTWSLDMRPR
jgi:3',5'-cyclic AMP phosphodiesterase CpdA